MFGPCLGKIPLKIRPRVVCYSPQKEQGKKEKKEPACTSPRKISPAKDIALAPPQVSAAGRDGPRPLEKGTRSTSLDAIWPKIPLGGVGEIFGAAD